MGNKTDLFISEEEALKLLTASFSDKSRIGVFDNYGNYSFPTDIAMNAPNSACGTSTTIITIYSCKD